MKSPKKMSDKKKTAYINPKLLGPGGSVHINPNFKGGQPQEAAPKLPAHIFLRHISTIKSHDRGKGGYFGNHKVISYHLQLTRGAQPPGQLSLYLLNDINSL